MSDAASKIGSRVLVTGMAGSGKSTFSRSLAAKTALAGHSSRPPVLEAALGCAAGARVTRETRRPARRRRVDRRRQLPRDTRTPHRTRGHRYVSRHAPVGVRGTRVPARPAEAGWGDAGGVRRFVLA